MYIFQCVYQSGIFSFANSILFKSLMFKTAVAGLMRGRGSGVGIDSPRV